VFLVSAGELRQLVPMADAIDAVEAAFVSEGATQEPLRLVTSDGSALAMVARRPPSEAAAGGTSFKLVTVWEPNRRRNLPTIHALVVWFDGQDHQPHLLVEGASLTALRTGATTGVATRILAAREASTLAMIGAGGQAADQIRGVCAVRQIDDVRIFSPSASAGRLVEQLASELPGVRLRHVSSAAEAVEDADVICCATTSREPVIPAEAVGDCVHVNAIGAYRPDMCELPPELFARADVVAVDSIHGATTEAGDVMAALSRGLLEPYAIAQIGPLVGAPPRSARLTIFKSVGNAIQDWAICQLLSTRIASDTRRVDLSSTR
jgi:ornithine cyclodeaminase